MGLTWQRTENWPTTGRLGTGRLGTGGRFQRDRGKNLVTDMTPFPPNTCFQGNIPCISTQNSVRSELFISLVHRSVVRNLCVVKDDGWAGCSHDLRSRNITVTSSSSETFYLAEKGDFFHTKKSAGLRGKTVASETVTTLELQHTSRTLCSFIQMSTAP